MINLLSDAIPSPSACMISIPDCAINPRLSQRASTNALIIFGAASIRTGIIFKIAVISVVKIFVPLSTTFDMLFPLFRLSVKDMIMLAA